jgi:hypothetical protein
MQLSNMRRITVRVHDLMCLAVINLRIFSVCLKAVGAERPCVNGVRTIDVTIQHFAFTGR